MSHRSALSLLAACLLVLYGNPPELHAHTKAEQNQAAATGEGLPPRVASADVGATASPPPSAAAGTGIYLQLNTTLLWLIITVLLLFLGDLIFVLLVRRKAESALKESVAQVNLLLNSAAEGIYGLDLNGNCTFCNPACLSLLGYQSESELLGRNLHEITHHTRVDGSPYPADECKICHAYQYESKVHLEDEVLWRKDGTSFPVEYWSYPLYKGKQTIGAVVSFLDITERKLAEQKLKAANEELDAFVYTVSHDLRTPISAVIGYADLLKEIYGKELSGDALELLKIIEQQGEKMSMIVEDLLALATTGNIEAPGQPIDTNDVLRFVLTELAGDIAKSGIEVHTEPLPPIQVPESLLIQVFENLIVNALRYAGPNGGPIEVGGVREGSKVSCFVRDHGRGIPHEEQAKVFNAFYRGTLGKQKTGSGVGLATVQKICHLYGGRASVEETPGGGATFRVELVDAVAPSLLDDYEGHHT
jgi:PAS domain S-box-containing protein